MHKGSISCLAVAALCLQACDRRETRTETTDLCSDAWYRSIEERLPTGDGQGHGPDVGSDEWKLVIEFKLGIRGEPDVPSRGKTAWCNHIDQIVQQKFPPKP